jgi:tetratricopeptide (TPR) repeat protein
MNARIIIGSILFAVCIAAHATDDSAEWKRLERNANIAFAHSEFSKAEKLLIAASQIADKFGPQDKRYAETYRSLGEAFFELQRFDLAADVYKRAADSDGQRLGTNELVVAEDLLRFVEMSGYAGNFLDGREALERATLIIREKGSDSPHLMGICYARRGYLELQESHFAVAETNFLKALEILETEKTERHFAATGFQMRITTFVPEQADAAHVLDQLGVCQTAEKKYSQAETSFLRSIDLMQWKYGKSSGTLVNPCYNLALCYLAEGKLADAEKMARRVFSYFDMVQGPKSMSEKARQLMSKVLRAEGKNDEARKFED